MALNCAAQGTFCLQCNRYCCGSRKCFDAVVYCEECLVAPYCSSECAEAHFEQHACSCSFLCAVADTPNHYENRKSAIAMYEWILFILNRGEETVLEPWLANARRKFVTKSKKNGGLAALPGVSRGYMSTQHDFEKRESVEVAVNAGRRNLIERSYVNRNILKKMEFLEMPEQEKAEATSTISPSVKNRDNVLVSVPCAGDTNNLESKQNDEKDQTPDLLKKYRETVAQPESLFTLFTLRLDNPLLASQTQNDKTQDDKSSKKKTKTGRSRGRRKRDKKSEEQSFAKRPTLFAFLHRSDILQSGGITKWSWSISVTVPPCLSAILCRQQHCDSLCTGLDCLEETIDEDNNDEMQCIPELATLLEPMLSSLSLQQSVLSSETPSIQSSSCVSTTSSRPKK